MKSEKYKHVGYYLISDGITELYKALQTNKKPYLPKNNVNKYILTITILSIITSILLSLYIYKQTNLILSIITFIITFIPVTQIVTDIVQDILNKVIKPTLIPKMDYSNGVPKEDTTMVIIPTIVTNGDKVKDLISKLEVFYLANKSENLYFTILGDASSSDKETLKEDEAIARVGLEEIRKLNEKYPNEDVGKFQFIYRKRVWNESEKCYLGWERKRGLITQFNEYLLGNIKNPFLANSFDEISKKIPKIKYIIFRR